MSPFFTIPEFHDFISPRLARKVLESARPIDGVEGLVYVGQGPSGLETLEALRFLRELYLGVRDELALVLRRRRQDRRFVDERVRACNAFNQTLERGVKDEGYATVLGLEDGQGRVVFGPKSTAYDRPGGARIAPLPEFLKGPHVTLFGPPDTAKLAINAVNAYHRRLPAEPPFVEELLAGQTFSPMWGADDEDSKTPLHEDLVEAAMNLTACFEGTLSFFDEGKTYALEPVRRALPIKRFPGLALPCTFLFHEESPIPLHLYDFALHVVRNRENPRALVFYVPKLENEEEAAYVHSMVSTAESLLRGLWPSYSLGTIRLMVVLENPRAILRTHEIMDALYPYFAGASLGWHDYLASTARLFKEDSSYRIPVKADPNIVIKHIAASHRLLADVVGSRGGIKVGGMYGILPIAGDRRSLQVTLRGFFKDVLTQLSRDLDGFWVAHPDFVRLGLAIVEAWRRCKEGDSAALYELVGSLLDERYRAELTTFISTLLDEARARSQPSPASGLPESVAVRSLIVADIERSDVIRNDDPEEIRYNVFQALQYLTDWLCGNGCVALPTSIDGVAVRVMDDLATAERSRWEVWHEIHHGRFSVEDLVRIAREELDFIRRDRSNDQKVVQVKWNERSARWYQVAHKLMLQLMTAEVPVEFATELLLPFTIGSIRDAEYPWEAAKAVDPEKFRLSRYVEDYDHFFEICGAPRFAAVMATAVVEDLDSAEATLRSFSKAEIVAAAGFHGDIGQSKSTLDARAALEQAQALRSEELVLGRLRELGQSYQAKFGFKFLVSAKGKSGPELLTQLEARQRNEEAQELVNARSALWEISRKRLELGARFPVPGGSESRRPAASLRSAQLSKSRLDDLRLTHGVVGVAIAVTYRDRIQEICLGDAERGKRPVTPSTRFELASLSKTLASAFVLEKLRDRLPPTTPVNELLSRMSSTFRLTSTTPGWADRVTVRDLLSHSALNMHYVNGFPSDPGVPRVQELICGRHGYPAVEVIHEPGRVFSYSGAGFLVLEHLVDALLGREARTHREAFMSRFGELTFEPRPRSDVASGYFDSGDAVSGGRLDFPAFAAGALGSARGMARFLLELTRAYERPSGSRALGHDTAVQMLHGSDKGCRAFMGCDMGLGVFVAEAGRNRFAIHQGANEGFRAIYLQCFAGPDRGKGLVVLCNGDNRAVPFIGAVVREILTALEVDGVDFDRLSSFSLDGLPQEQVVNLGYKAMILDSFRPDLPEPIDVRGPRDPLAEFNVATRARIRSVSNQKFARAENLINPFQPTFDPELFGRQGKVMDSWESARHNPSSYETLELELEKPAVIRYVSLSTKYHDGNQAEHVRLEGFDSARGEWSEVLPKTPLAGHAQFAAELETQTPPMSRVRVFMYPDGGLTRLGLFESLPPDVAPSFLRDAVCVRYPDPIPRTKKPLSLGYSPSVEEIEQNVRRTPYPDWASAAFGAKLLSVTNEHYGPAKQVISPFPPIHMFDGLESARSRDPNHHEEVVIQLGRPIVIARILVDFQHFVNNNPRELSVHGAHGEAPWIELAPRTSVKEYAGNRKEILVEHAAPLDRIRVRTFPDGGINRIHVYAVVGLGPHGRVLK
ncbi:MAG: serine hydrolase [Deltaproteobacteria bacterium]|nr:serine hydrolase [Deltaproteobacteria bacterium]